MSQTEIGRTLRALEVKTENPSDTPPVAAKSDSKKSVKESSTEEDYEGFMVSKVADRTGQSQKRRSSTALPDSSSRAKKGKVIASPAPKRTTRSNKKITTEEVLSDDEITDMQRGIIPELVIDVAWLEEKNLGEVLEILKTQQWDKLFQGQTMVNENLIRHFYASLKVIDKPGRVSATFEVDGDEFDFSSRDIAKWFDVPHDGYSIYNKRQWPESVAKKDVTNRVGTSTNNMNIVTRILHRLLVQNICPRMQKHEQLLIHDHMLLDHLIQRKSISLPRQIMLHMNHAITNPNHGLPYPGLVKQILIENKVYKAENEVLMSQMFDDKNCENMGFVFDEKEGWTKEGVFVPTGKELVSTTDYKLEVKKMLTAVEGKVTLMTKTINTLVGGVADKLTGMELDNKVERDEFLKKISKIESSLQELKDWMAEHTTKVEDNLAELREKLVLMGREVVKHLEEVFLAANLEIPSVPSQP